MTCPFPANDEHPTTPSERTQIRVVRSMIRRSPIRSTAEIMHHTPTDERPATTTITCMTCGHTRSSTAAHPRFSRNCPECRRRTQPTSRRIPDQPGRAARCGTDPGYYRHKRTLREPACHDCRRAHAQAEADRKARRKEAA